MANESQLDAILQGAAFASIADRAFLRITGSDATRWLNGMVTNSVKDLQPGEGSYSFLLNNQGRILGDCTIYRESTEDPTYLLATDKSQVDAIQQHLDKFIIMDDVELISALEDEQSLLILGPEAPAQFTILGLPLPAPLHLATTTTADGAVTLITPAGSLPAFELRGSAETIAALRARITIPEATTEALEAHRIHAGTPRYGTDIRNTDAAKDLPQETAQTHALHFSKGCYLGQEIVERIHSRGNVHRTFAKFTLTGTLPTLPTPLESNGKSVGELTSAANVGDTILALGYARREALDTHQPLTYSGGTAAQR
jgi:folate-binding protein YgfZ